MQNLSKVSKIYLGITLIFFGLWLGSYIVRQAVIYGLFEKENLVLKSIYQGNNLYAVLSSILPIFIFNIVSYLILLIAFVLFLISCKLNLKREGWLFVSTLIVFICAPFEIYLLLKDYKIVELIMNGNYEVQNVITLIKTRLSQFDGFSQIEIFSFIGIVFLSIFQPLRKLG